ncbi:MAG: ABC transporter permease [Hymenobacteraceae bacterium]|nr:ABC transporter permease [Hymenobacteraceae bacterium]
MPNAAILSPPLLLPAASPAPASAGRSPGYYAWRRLRRNVGAMGGLLVIATATLVALLGYAIMPDSSPNANAAVPALQKQPPGFTVPVVWIKRPDVPPAPSALQFLLHGREPATRLVPTARLVALGRDSVQLDPPISLGLPIGSGEIVRRSELADNRASAQSPTYKSFPLGTDRAGRDVLSRLLLGTRISLGIGLVAALLSLVVGATVGAIGGYFGGWPDRAARFLMTVVWSIPGVMLVVAISLAVGSKDVWVTFVAVGLTMWVDVARVVRGQMLALKEKPFVDAQRVLGIPTARLVVRHLLPNMLGPLIVVTTANFASAILLEAGLSFLGLGVQPPAPSWGLMVSEGFQLLGTRAGFWLTLWPSLAISALVFAFNLLGNGLRDAFDPATPLTAGRT